MFIGGKEVVGKILNKADLMPKGIIDCRVNDIYDGDTFTIIYYTPEIGRFMKEKVRMARIDAAEIRKPPKIVENSEQKLSRVEKALHAKNELTEIIGSKEVKVDIIGTEKYGRCLAEVYIRFDLVPTRARKDIYAKIVDDVKYLNVSSYLLGENIVELYSK